MRARADIHALTVTALLAATAAVLGLVESAWLPPLPIPGMRLGLANIAVLLAVLVLGPRRGLAVALAKVLLTGMAAGTLGGPAIVLSGTGTLAAWAAMSALSLAGSRFSAVGLSVGGAAAHMAGQVAAACLLTASVAPLVFAPVLLGAAVPAGLAVGALVRLLVSRLPHSMLAPASAQ